MHESGVVDQVINTIKAKLKKMSPMPKIKKVNILIGELEQIAPDHFEFHFRERVKGSFLEKAKLNIKSVKVKFRCRDCGNIFLAKEGIKGCPGCKSNLSDIIEGNKIIVESIEV